MVYLGWDGLAAVLEVVLRRPRRYYRGCLTSERQLSCMLSYSPDIRPKDVLGRSAGCLVGKSGPRRLERGFLLQQQSTER